MIQFDMILLFIKCFYRKSTDTNLFFFAHWHYFASVGVRQLLQKSETIGSLTKLGNNHNFWVIVFKKCVRCTSLPTNIAALKI